MRVIYVRPSGPGWGPLEQLAVLAAYLLEGTLHVVSMTRSERAVRRFLGQLPRPPRGEPCLIIAPQPRHLCGLIDFTHFFSGDSYVAAWIIDSFWVNQLPRFANTGRNVAHIDKYYIADAEFADEWRRMTGSVPTWLPWGSDALRSGSAGHERPVDVQRLGRMPKDWDDDHRTARAFHSMGITFKGRPPFHNSAAVDQLEVLAALSRAKYTLSFTNRLSPSAATHPSHEYLTGRWTDAVTCGASVVGVPPRCAATEELLWPEALIGLKSMDLADGIATVREATSEWTPALPALNHANALRRLDWRWRISQIASDMGLNSPALVAELADLRRAIDAG